ncbi:MAG: YjgP/YjgQ family permease [Planctomycetota bacterium]|nr:MAG: YjgP/YjgQ family permease [Planctomycetota bacterium]
MPDSPVNELFFLLRIVGVYGISLVAAFYLAFSTRSILGRYFLGQVLKNFLLTLTILVGVVLFFTAAQMLHKGLLVHFIRTAHLTIFLYLPWGVIQVSYLVAVTLALGRMAADNEIDVLRSSGVSLVRIIGPVIAFGAILSGVSFWISSEIAPYCYAQKQLAPRAFVRELESLASGRNKTIQFGDFKFFCSNFDKNVFHNITLYRRNVEPYKGRNQKTLKQFKANRAYLGFHESGKIALFRMIDVQVVQIKPEFMYWKFDSCDLPFILARTPRIGPAACTNAELHKMLDVCREKVKEGMADFDRLTREKDRVANDPNMSAVKRERLIRSIDETSAVAYRMWWDGKTEFYRFLTELHRRYAFPLMPFLWTLIALPIALTLRRQNRLVPMFISLLLALLLNFAPTIVGMNFCAGGSHPGTKTPDTLQDFYRMPLDQSPPLSIWVHMGTAFALILIIFLNLYLPYRMRRGKSGWFTRFLDGLTILLAEFWKTMKLVAGKLVSLTAGSAAMGEGGEYADPDRRLEARRGLWRWMTRLRITIFDAYCSRLFIARLVMCGLSFLALFICLDLILNLNKFRSNLQISVISLIFQHYTVYSLAILYNLAPFIALLAAMFTVTRLNKSNELVPLMVAGVPTVRTLVPVFIGTFVFSVIMMGAQEFIVPRMADSMRRTKGLAFVRPMIFPDSYGNLFNMDRYFPSMKRMENIQITNDATGNQIFAGNASFTRVKVRGIKVRGWRLNGCTVYRFGADRRLLNLPDGTKAIEKCGDSLFIACVEPDRTHELPPEFRDFRTDIKPEDLESSTRGIYDLAHLSMRDLLRQHERRPYLTHLNMQFWSRITFTFSNLVLLLIGLPFALKFTMRSYFYGVAMCICVCLVFIIITYLFAELGNRGDLMPVIAAWMPIAIFGAAGVAFFDGVTT